MAQIQKWTDRNWVPHQEPICLPQKHNVLAQNLFGNEFVDLRKYACALIIDRRPKVQSRTIALPCPYDPLLIHLCFFSLSIIRDKYDKKEKIVFFIEFHLHVQHDEIARVPYQDITERYG